MAINDNYKLIFTERFKHELEEIDYSIINNLYLKNSKETMNKIDDLLMQIKLFPKAFSRIRHTNYRKAPTKKYIIIYRFNEKKKQIYILHIFYSKSDYIKKIFF